VRTDKHRARDSFFIIVFALFSITVSLCIALPVKAQQAKRIPRVGFITAGSSTTIASRIAAFRQGLRELGYVEDKNIVIHWRFAEGKLERLPVLVAEVVRLNVDIILSAGSGVTHPAKNATATIPIVMAQDTDPVGNGFVASLARPGGNITGLSSYSAELNGKRLELLKDILPRLSRVAVLGDSSYPGNAQALKQVELAAPPFGVKVQYVDILRLEDFESAFRAAGQSRADAGLVLQSSLFNSHRKELADLAMKARLPMIYYAPEWTEAGGLVSYAASINDLYRRAAVYVDKILKGAKPADLPVEQPTKFELVINLKTAKQIGLTIPPNVLARADRVIK
jgi:putative ABC transport system substrate-binding protein